MAEDQPIDGLRRTLVAAGGLGLGAALAAAGSAGAQGRPGPNAVDEGAVDGGKVVFPPIHAQTERPDTPPPNADPPSRRVGFAVLGLGRLALENILPAFAQCRRARPVALISGDPEKMKTVAASYGIAQDACYGYGEMERMAADPRIEVVYVVTPNALHHHGVLAAAKAGKHVLCEKPMAATVDQAREMVAACRRAGRALMIAYRCQYETYNVALAKRARAGELGAVQVIDAVNTQNQGDPRQWRQIKALSGGGSLPDVGLYCLNTSRALLGEEPVEISAMIRSPPHDPRFAEVESTVSFTLRFPSGVIANCVSSYSLHETRTFKVLGSEASATLENAFGYSGQKLRLSRRDGEGESDTTLSLTGKNQFSLEIDHMAECVRSGETPRTPGEEGLQDMILMAAIYEAARTGRPVTLSAVARRDAFRGVTPQDG